MFPFKTYYTQAIENWLLKHHRGCKVTIYQIGEIFGGAITKAVTYNTAINGFRETRLFPLNQDLFQESDFLHKKYAPANLAPVEIQVPKGMSTICESPSESCSSYSTNGHHSTLTCFSCF